MQMDDTVTEFTGSPLVKEARKSKSLEEFKDRMAVEKQAKNNLKIVKKYSTSSENLANKYDGTTEFGKQFDFELGRKVKGGEGVPTKVYEGNILMKLDETDDAITIRDLTT